MDKYIHASFFWKYWKEVYVARDDHRHGLLGIS